MQRLKTRVQFQAVMAGRTIVSKTAHFALHRMELDAPPAAPTEPGYVENQPGCARMTAAVAIPSSTPSAAKTRLDRTVNGA